MSDEIELTIINIEENRPATSDELERLICGENKDMLYPQISFAYSIEDDGLLSIYFDSEFGSKFKIVK